jgi:Secretion system C-terminal sorting domain
MKKITLFIFLAASSIGFAQEFPLNFTNSNQLFTGVGGAATSLVPDPTASTNQVLRVIGNGQPFDTAQLNLLTNYINLADNANNTITFRVRPEADYGTRTHLLKFESVGPGGGAAATELQFTTTGTGWTNVSLDFPAGLGNYRLMVLFPDFNNTQVGNYLFDDFSGGTNIAPPPPAFVPDQAPIPSTPPAQVLKIYGDTGGFTNTWVPAYSFGGYESILDLDSGTSVNEAIKMNFAAQGFGQGTDPAVVTNVSTYGYLNFSYYVQSGTANAGSLGHQFYFDLISRIGSTNTEAFYGIGPALTTVGNPSEHVKKIIVFDSWQTVSIPLSDFVGFSTAHFFQFKIGSSSDLRTKIAYFDNIYFSVNPGTLNTNNFNISKVKLYPNPTSNVLNIESVGTIQNIAIFNVLGQEVMNKTANESLLSIDVSGLNAGVYVIKTVIDGTVSSTKFIKE